MTSLSFHSQIIGEDPERVKHYQPAGQKKVILYSTSLFIPVILWFINGLLLSKQIIETSWLIAILVAFVMASIIFLIERTIILSNGGWWVNTFRIILGMLISILGAISLDEVIFKEDIDIEMAKMKQNFVTNQLSQNLKLDSLEIAQKEQQVQKLYQDWQTRLNDVNTEMKGMAGSSGFRGLGEIAKQNLAMAQSSEVAYQTVFSEVNMLKNNYKIKVASLSENKKSEFNESALLLRIKALFKLVMGDPYMFFIYVVISLLLVFFEFIVVIIKLTSKKTADELILEAREEYLLNNLQMVKERHKLYLKQHPNVSASIEALNGIQNYGKY